LPVFRILFHAPFYAPVEGSAVLADGGPKDRAELTGLFDRRAAEGGVAFHALVYRETD
jgi:hypothetical protein